LQSDFTANTQRPHSNSTAIVKLFRGDGAAIVQRLRSDCGSNCKAIPRRLWIASAVMQRLQSDFTANTQRPRSNSKVIVKLFRGDGAAIAEQFHGDCGTLQQ
jgi:hypothetical protein